MKRLLATSAQLKIEDPRYLEMRFAADQARDQFESTDSLFKELNARLSSKDEVLGLSGFQLVLRAAAVVEILNVDPCHTLLLLARMEMAGGSYRIVKSLSRLVFGGDGVDYSAGVIASFGVFQLDGSLIDSGILTTQASFRPIAKAGFWHDRFVPLLVILLLSTLVYRLIR